MRTDERQIHDVHTRWIAAVNAGDLAHLLPLMADDVVFLNPGQAPFGRDGFSLAFSSAHQQAVVRCVSEVAYTRSRDGLSVTRRGGGEATHLAGYRITIYRRQPDGRWLLARDAHTLSSAEQ